MRKTLLVSIIIISLVALLNAKNTIIFKHDGIIVGQSKIPNAGLGVMVTKNIKQGQVLLIERALFQFDKNKDIDISDAPILQQEWNKLSPDIKQEIVKLGSIKWSGFPKKFFDYGWANGIYKILSLINHGYPANIALFTKHNVDDYPYIVVATKDLHSGDELQYDYLNFVYNAHLDGDMEETRINMLDIAIYHNIEHTLPKSMDDDLKQMHEWRKKGTLHHDDLVKMYGMMEKYYSNSIHEVMAAIFAESPLYKNMINLDVNKYYFVVDEILQNYPNKFSNDLLQICFHLWFTNHDLMKSIIKN